MNNHEQRELLRLQLMQAVDMLDAYEEPLPTYASRANLQQVLQAVRKSSIEWQRRAYSVYYK